MTVHYFYRNNKAGFSILKVFAPITKEVGKYNAVNEYFVPERRAGILSLFKNIYFVYRNRTKTGINHITGDIHYCMIALIGCKTVLTIHDLSMMDCVNNKIKKKIIKWFWFSIPVYFANEVVCISEYTRKELLKIIKTDKAIVIHNALDPSFFARPKRFETSMPNILQVGSGWNKNLANVIEATKELKCFLTIIGYVDNNTLAQLEDWGTNYIVKQNLSDEDLLAEYYNADIVSFCSIYEGFGMPIIEANAVGRCVITSDISPMSEISADAACKVNPFDRASIRAGFIRVINDNYYRAELINNGFINANRFTANIAFSKYMHLYKLLVI